MGFPALTWDGEVSEPYCTGCMGLHPQLPYAVHERADEG